MAGPDVDDGPLAVDRDVLLEHEAKDFLSRHGLPVPEGRLATSPADAADAAGAVGLPVVLKVVSPDMAHKSDVGGVLLGVDSPEAAAEGYGTVLDAVRGADPDARIEGVLVEEMIDGRREVFVGVTRDRNFGPVVMAGLGGVTVELFEDVSVRLPPLDATTCRGMLESLTSYPLLAGYRGEPPADVDALVDVMTGLAGEGGVLEGAGDRIAEMDLNPIIVREEGEGCVVSDALIRLSG